MVPVKIFAFSVVFGKGWGNVFPAADCFLRVIDFNGVATEIQVLRFFLCILWGFFPFGSTVYSWLLRSGREATHHILNKR